jgi:two-component system LytT family response regulator
MKALTIDDKPRARREMSRLLGIYRPQWQILEAGSVDEALAVLEEVSPGVIFLAADMPGKDGFQLLEQRTNALPPVVLTSNGAHHAAKAFDYQVLDYLLKPVDPERFLGALERVEECTRREESAVCTNDGARGPGDHLLISDQYRCWFIAVGDIAAIESDGNYARLIGPAGNPMVPRTLDYMEGRLDPKLFFRANRKMIINVSRITAVRRVGAGQYAADIEPIGQVEFSRRQSQVFRQKFGF